MHGKVLFFQKYVQPAVVISTIRILLLSLILAVVISGTLGYQNLNVV